VQQQLLALGVIFLVLYLGTRYIIVETFKDKSKQSKGKEKSSVNAEDHDIEIT
jgi:hypothetical protein